MICIDVAAGILTRENGEVLLACRPADKPWPGWWELPGGKIEAGESVGQALARELHEEIGIEVTQAKPWITRVHTYPERQVRLTFCRVSQWRGTPYGREGQQLCWAAPEQALKMADLLPATYPPLRWLGLPARYAISSADAPAGLNAWWRRLDKLLANGVSLLQWREPAWPQGPHRSECHAALQQTLARCRAAGARLLVNSVHPPAWWQEADGVHLRSAEAARLSSRPPVGLVGMSTHNREQLAQAHAIDADFAVLGPVCATASHPGVPGIGWTDFSTLVKTAMLPVYALGGQSVDTLEAALACGAHGIAAIRGL